MKRFRKILLWYDDSPAGQDALSQATAVVRETRAALTIAHALAPPPRLMRALYPQADQLHGLLVREWEQRLEDLAIELRAEGLSVSTQVYEGDAFLEFTRAVLREQHELLIKPTGEGGSEFALDSTDMHLLRKCPCAVWLTGASAPSRGRILALVDPEPDSLELNRRIVQTAASLAISRGVELEVLHAWEVFGEELIARRLGRPELEEYFEEYRARSAAELDALLTQIGVELPREHVHHLKGELRELVPAFALEREVGLIVMGTVCRTGIPGVLIGNTAETLLTHVHHPVLTVKPRGFRSPME